MSLSERDYMYEPRAFRGRRRGITQRVHGRWTTARMAAFWVAALWVTFFVLTRLLDRREATPFPPTGETLWYSASRQPAIAMLTMHAPQKSGKNFAVRLADWDTGSPIALIPVRAGETSVTLIPLGRYRVTIAKGQHWFGPEKLFGRRGEVREAVHSLDFYQRANQTIGHRITLESLKGGMEMKAGKNVLDRFSF